MGSSIIELIGEQQNQYLLTGAITRDAEAGLADNNVIKNPEEAICTCDVVIDFSVVENITNTLSIAVKYKKPIVIGITGLQKEHKTEIENAAKQIPIVYSENMAISVNLMLDFIKNTSRKVKNIQNVIITEKHREDKKDSISGTALKIKEQIEEEIDQQKVKTKSIRKGNISGEHEITFESENEIITISHKANSRKTYAEGSLIAAKWIKTKKTGLYGMREALDAHQNRNIQQEGLQKK